MSETDGSQRWVTNIQKCGLQQNWQRKDLAKIYQKDSETKKFM